MNKAQVEATVSAAMQRATEAMKVVLLLNGVDPVVAAQKVKSVAEENNKGAADLRRQAMVTRAEAEAAYSRAVKAAEAAKTVEAAKATSDESLARSKQNKADKLMGALDTLHLV